MSSRPFAPRTEQQRAAVQARQAFPGSVAGSVRNAGPVSQAGRTAVRVPTSTTLSAETFWVEDHFSVSASALGPFTLSYVPRTNSEDVKVNGVGVLRVTEWTRSGVTLTVDAGVFLGIGTDTWDLTVQYEVASSVATLAVSISTYASEVLADGPVAFWRLGEASGTTMVDSSGNHYDGIYYGSPTLGTPGLLTGDTDTAVTLNGTSQKGQYGAGLGGGTLAVEAIINPSAIGGARGIVAHTYAGADPGYSVFTLDITAAGLLRFGVVISGVWHYATGSTTLIAGDKHHVAGIYDGTTISVLLDGAVDGSTAVAGTADSHGGSSIDIGFSEAAGYFIGVLDEVAFYGSAISTARLAAHAAAI